MGVAIDTILTSAVNPGVTAAAFTPTVSGDSLTLRNANDSAGVYLEHVIRRGATAGMARVRSVLMADDVSGVQFFTGETPAGFLVPGETGDPLHSGDTLIVEGTGGAAETDLIALSVAYYDLPGAAARLHTWADIQPLIAHIKPVHVAVTNAATIGQWKDTPINTSEALLKSKVDYAVLGYLTSLNIGFVGVRGQATSNMRYGGPGYAASSYVADWFVAQDRLRGIPRIPVFNGSDAGAFYVSTFDSSASTTPDVTIICAELSQTLPS